MHCICCTFAEVSLCLPCRCEALPWWHAGRVITTVNDRSLLNPGTFSRCRELSTHATASNGRLWGIYRHNSVSSSVVINSRQMSPRRALGTLANAPRTMHPMPISTKSAIN